MPGRDLIDTLPLVWQIVFVSALWQVGRAPAMGAETPAKTVKPAINIATAARPIIL